MAQHMIILARCLAGFLLIVQFPACAGENGRDPTLPPALFDAPAVSNSNNTSPVQFISIQGKQRTAIVRGRTVRVGDTISEGRIIGITGNGVWVRSDDGSRELKLFPDVDKRSHASNPASPVRGIQR
ncbi:MAG TPA: hypothetical protein VFN66_03880 [Burkholderiales bacterium]|nr:hypothetical protein [Burkholderiales bacterium]